MNGFSIARLQDILDEEMIDTDVDGIKVYYAGENDFCIKGIKNGEVVLVNRKSRKHAWKDLKNDTNKRNDTCSVKEREGTLGKTDGDHEG